MTVYVDTLMGHGWRLRGRATRSCHMFTDGPLAELDALAAKISLKRGWRDDKRAGFEHYDLTPGKREQAIRAGAWPVTSKKAVEIWRRR